jgi:hypothetical protein
MPHWKKRQCEISKRSLTVLDWQDLIAAGVEADRRA